MDKVQTLVTTAQAELDGWVAAWLDEVSGRTQSARTARTYRETMERFRHALAQVGLDLDGPTRQVALVAQSWAGQTERVGRASVANATYNLRLAVISSFYRYIARAADWAESNPILKVRRRPVSAYAGARPLDLGQTQARLEEVAEEGETQLAAARDYALFLLALSTGRRAAELAGLSWGDVDQTSRGVRVTFGRTKGGKPMQDLLDPDVGAALLTWLRLFYGELSVLASEDPVFVCLSNRAHGHRLVHSSLSRLARKRLGTSKVHATRHTFAVAMLEEGAKLTEIAGRLGHTSTEATAHYLEALTSDLNPFAGKVAARFKRRQQQPI